MVSPEEKLGNGKVEQEFIRIYQGEPCLWRIKSKDYHDKGKRDDAYKRLVEKLKEIDPSADRYKVKYEPLPGEARPPKRMASDKCDSVLQTIEDHFKKPTLKDDRYDIFGKNVSMKLRDLTNNTQRLLAEKIINEALFLAEMVQLTLSHCINASSTFNTPQYSNPNFINSVPPPVQALRSQDTITVSPPLHIPRERYYEATSDVENNYSATEDSNHYLASFISNHNDC
ncbi:uncharacterized protein LOC110832535 [Zootermopsis nevadensis]|uniref:uncharacterized protein LOC110832535 n=1 Tax=Zootermopsis nevadensis TaxID=136037 RepID=UPI000B8ED4B8|nr:uncharacterized protein LOC110832535 [Zootermopsis nevadensis]